MDYWKKELRGKEAFNMKLRKIAGGLAAVMMMTAAITGCGGKTESTKAPENTGSETVQELSLIHISVLKRYRIP